MSETPGHTLGATEMLLLGERDQKIQLVDHSGGR
jgi:hypothetical protein